MDKPKLTALIILTALFLTVTVTAQWGGVQTPKYYNLTFQILDSRALIQWTQQFTTYTVCNAWAKSLVAYPVHQFAAKKNFTLIIREIPSPDGKMQYGDTPLANLTLTATADDCGVVRFQVTVPKNVDDTKKAYGWHVVLLLDGWPTTEKFVIYGLTLWNLSFEELAYRLTGRTGAGQPVEYLALTEWGVWEVHNRLELDCKNRIIGPYAKIYSSVIHVYFVKVRGNDVKFAPEQFTGYEVFTVGGRTYNWRIDYHKGAYLYASAENSLLPDDQRPLYSIVSALGYNSTSGETQPFVYLASYVTDVNYYVPELRVKVVKYDPTQVSLVTRVDLTTDVYSTTVIEAKNDIWYPRYINRTNLKLPQFSVKTVKAPILYLTGMTLNWTLYPGYGVVEEPKPLSCGNVAWPIPLQDIEIPMLLDVKGNPILTPNAFIFKIQVKFGDNQWVTIDKAYGAWKTGITDLLSALKVACSQVGISPITSFNDLLQCYRKMDRNAFRDAIFRLYEPARLVRVVGKLTLSNFDKKIDTSGVAFVSKLVVEYSYNRENIGANTVVLEMPLTSTSRLKANLTVSVLPIKILLWKWGNATLPLADRGYRYTDADEVAGLRFVVDSDGGVYLDYMGDKIISVDPWSGQLIWTLPPYEFVPALVGTRATALALLNASGYLPLPPVVVLFYDDNNVPKLRYLSDREVTSSDLYKRYELSTRVAMRYRFSIYQGDVRIGVANLKAYYPVSQTFEITVPGTAVIPAQSRSALVEADYSGSDDPELSRQAYVLSVSEGSFRIYDMEHTLHIAVFRILQNALIRDACGNVITGLSTGTAYLDIVIPVDVDGKMVNITITRVPLLAEVPIRLAIPIDDWGIPKINFAGGYLEAYAYLNYFGYKLSAAGNASALASGTVTPIRIPVYKIQAAARKPVFYLPIAPVVFRVWSNATYLNVDPRKDVLMGFVVTVTGADGNEISRGISRKDGQALLVNVPLGVNVNVRVRTIAPSKDKVYIYTYDQDQFGSSYLSYLKVMGYDVNDLKRKNIHPRFWPEVYTLGTRDDLDENKVVYKGKVNLDLSYACGKKPYDLEVGVFDLVVRLFDKTGKYLLSSQYVNLGPYPGATDPIPLNVTLIIDGGVWYGATMWRPPMWGLPEGRRVGDHVVLTDFRIVGITGMRPIYERLAEYYLAKAKQFAGCPNPEPTLPPDYRKRVANILGFDPRSDTAAAEWYRKIAFANASNALAFAAMAGWLANFSTTSPAAVFLLTSNQPKELPYLCDFTVKTVGAGEVARLFMLGQRFRVIVWYMGYKVFDDYVTITGPVLDIKTDVVPVRVNTVSKSGETQVASLIGYTFTDAFVGHFVAKKFENYLSNESQLKYILGPFYDFYSYARGLELPLKWRLDNYTVALNFSASPPLKTVQDRWNAYRNGKLQYNSRVGGPYPDFYGWYREVSAGSDFVYLPNAVVLRNATDPLYMAAVGRSTESPTMKECTNETVLGEKAIFNTTIRFSTSGRHSSVGGASSYQIVLVPANNAKPPVVSVANSTSFSGIFNGTYTLIISANPVLFPNGTIKYNYFYQQAFNGSIRLDIHVKRGVINYLGNGYYEFNVIPADQDNAIDVSTLIVAYNVTYTNVNATVCRNVTKPAPYTAEYIISFDRWVTVSKYQWYYRTLDVFERTAEWANWYGFYPLLTESGGCIMLNPAERVVQPLDTTYRFRIILRGDEVLNYRTVEVMFPVWRNASRVEVEIRAYNLSSPGLTPLIDKIVYNVTTMLWNVTDNSASVRLLLLFGKVSRNILRIVTEDQRIRFDIYVRIYTPAIDREPDVRVCKLVPLYNTYEKVSMYECQLPGRPRIDPETYVSVIDLNRDLVNKAIFEGTWGSVGFGTPITYVVKAGEVALLPAWYTKTAVHGSRIARIWVVNASSDPSVGPALGTKFAVVEWSDPKVTVRGYKLKSYLVINYVPNLCPAGWIARTYLDEFDGEGYITGLGFGTSGTSSLIIGQHLGVPAWNSTALWMRGGNYTLRTVALDRITVENLANYPIYVAGVRIKYVTPEKDVYTYTASVEDVMKSRIDAGQTGTVKLVGYGFGRTYGLRILDVWSAKLFDPAYTYTVLAYHGGVVDTLRYFGMDLGGKRIQDIVKPLVPPYVSLNVLYASHMDVDQSKVKNRIATYSIFNGKITEYTQGIWEDLSLDVADVDYKYVFSMASLPLKEIRDWNDRPLANQTVALFDRYGNLYAVTYSTDAGVLAHSLPDLSSMGKDDVVRVAWYNGYLVQLLRGKPEFTIWVYDQQTLRDVTELGNATTNSKIRTYVYPLTVTVKDESGKPLTNMYVKVVDTSTIGQLVNAANKTGADGGAQVVDLRISKYSSGVMSQVPGTSYYYYVYDPSGALVAVGRFEIQRGASVPSTGWNVVATVRYATEIPVKNSATRGYILVKGVEFLNGTKRDVRIPFTVSGGVMALQGKVPISVEYPIDIYVTHVTLGGQEVPVKGGQVLVFSGKTTDLLAGLDFAELGLTGIVTIQAVDATGAPRSDWTVQILYGNITAAQAGGQIQVVLPRIDVLGQPYTIKVITNAVTPDGKALVKTQTLELKQKAYALQIPVSTVKAVVQVVDGFGNVRNDWPVVVENVATGMGQITTELVEGERYVARATGLGFTNTTTFTAKGPQVVISVKIPTGKLVAQVVDGFGNVRSDWTVNVVGVTTGQGTVGPVEVLAGQYTVKTSVFNKEFTQTVNVGVGQTATATIQVPTAKLSITAVDDDKKPIDNYVTYVGLTGPLTLEFTSPPKSVEVLAGSYQVKVSALGKDATAQVTLNAGDVKNIQVVVPGTAGLDFFGTRIPLPTLVLYALLLLVVIVILAILIIEYNNWRRRRLMQILAPPK